MPMIQVVCLTFALPGAIFVLLVAHRRPECTHAVQSDLEDTVHSSLVRKVPLHGLYIQTLEECY
jgi:hypothetical protein